MDRVGAIAEELARLHRGRGVHVDDLPARLGPHLRVIVFGDVGPDQTGADEAIRHWLTTASADLPPDLRLVFRRASGLADQQPFLTERLMSLADSTGLSTRTIMRRLGEANALVAAGVDRRTSVSVDDNPFAGRGWYVDRLESTAYLGEALPRFVGTREIFVTLDGLEYICESLSIPQPPGEAQPAELLVMATEGCELDRLERMSPSTWKVWLRLPQTLLIGSGIGSGSPSPCRPARSSSPTTALCRSAGRARSRRRCMPRPGSSRVRGGAAPGD